MKVAHTFDLNICTSYFLCNQWFKPQRPTFMSCVLCVMGVLTKKKFIYEQKSQKEAKREKEMILFLSIGKHKFFMF